MLPSAQRLTSRESFRLAVRRGRRYGTATMVLYLATSPDDARSDASADPACVGFIVSKAVGSAVVRNRVKRRLRHLVRSRLGLLPSGGTLVVRALSAAASATSAELGADLDRSLSRVVRASGLEAEPA